MCWPAFVHVCVRDPESGSNFPANAGCVHNGKGRVYLLYWLVGYVASQNTETDVYELPLENNHATIYIPEHKTLNIRYK